MSWGFQFDQVTYSMRIVNGKYPITNGADTVRTRLFMRLNRILGEWFLNTTVGVNYYDPVTGIFNNKLPASAILGAVRAAILEDPDVNEVIDATIVRDPDSPRAYRISVVCTIKGEQGTLSFGTRVGAFS